MITLNVPAKAIRRVVKGERQQKFHLVRTERDYVIHDRRLPGHRWECGCGEVMSTAEQDPANYDNAHLRTFEILDTAEIVAPVDLCIRCWMYSITEVK